MRKRHIQSNMQSLPYESAPRPPNDAGTSIFVDDEFIADDDSSPVPYFEDDEPEDDAGRDECDETSRGGFDACFFDGFLEGVKGAETGFAHRRRRGWWAGRQTWRLRNFRFPRGG